MENKRRTEIKQQSIFDYKSLIKALDEAGVKRIHAYTIWRNVVQKNIKDLSEIKEIPKAAYKLINEKFSILNIQLANSQTSKDGNTTKIIFRLQDSHEIEAVIMRYGDDQVKENSNTNISSPNQKNTTTDAAPAKYKRISICVSSQIGCRMGCTFCATGFMGLKGSLLSGEILQQLYYIKNVLNEPVRNVVFMGMGEPLENYDEVIDAIRLMVDPRLFSLSSGHILVSTVGIPSNIVNLADDLPGVGLCLSLHAPNQALRERIVPVARLYKIHELMRSLDIFIFKTVVNKCYRNLMDERNKSQIKANMNYNDFMISNKLLYGHKMIIIEYTLLEGVNDSESHAVELANLLINTPISKNILDELVVENRDHIASSNIHLSNENFSNLKNHVAKIIYKELSKGFNRTNFAIVNLIPYNKTSTSINFSTPSKETIAKFAKILFDMNIFVTIRRNMGDSIFGACGQLALKVKNYNIEDVNQQLNMISDDDDDDGEEFVNEESMSILHSSEVEDSEYEIPTTSSTKSKDRNYIPGTFVKNTLTSSMYSIQTKFSNKFQISNTIHLCYNILKNLISNNKTSFILFIGSGFFIHYLFRRHRNSL